MNRRILFWLFAAGLIILTLACGLGPAASTPNTQATIDAAVQATANAQVAGQATIDAAVQATTAAQAAAQATVDAAVAATATAQAVEQAAAQPTVDPTAEPASSDEYITMTEEELAALIDQTVDEAIQATEAYSAAATDATADSAVTAEEVETIEVYLAGAEEAIALAEELVYVYADLYGELATETVAALYEVNQSLAEIAAYAAAMDAALSEINTSLEQGLELAEDTIAQVESAAQAAITAAGNIHQQAENWQVVRQNGLESRVSEALAVQPDHIATDPQAAVQSALDFLTAGHQAIGDHHITPSELANLAQLGANASASLNAQEGRPQLQQLAGSISGITEDIARGNVSRAEDSLNRFNQSLHAIPDLEVPDIPDISRPSVPDIERPSAPDISRPSAPDIGKPSRRP